MELGVSAGEPEVTAICQAVLGSWADPARLAGVPVVEGRARRCASQEGNAFPSCAGWGDGVPFWR